MQQLQRALTVAQTRVRTLERQIDGGRGAASTSASAGCAAVAGRVISVYLSHAALSQASLSSGQTASIVTMHQQQRLTLVHMRAYVRQWKNISLVPHNTHINVAITARCSASDRPSAQTQLLEQELSAAREEAAAATAHMKQFQALAKSSDQALRDMQVHCPLLPRMGENICTAMSN